jgi:hypothetical protein
VADPLRRQLDPGTCQLFGQSAFPVPARGESERVRDGVADEADRHVAQVEQVPGGQRATRHVVADHPRQLGDFRGVDVDEDDRDRAPVKRCARSGSWRQRHDEQAVGSLRVGQRVQVVVAFLNGLDVVDDQVELAVGQDGVDAAETLGRLGSREEGHEDPDRQGASEAQPTGRRAGCEAQLFHDREDSLAGPGVHDVLAVQGPRGSRDADPCVARDVANGDGLPRHGPPPRALKPVS